MQQDSNATPDASMDEVSRRADELAAEAHGDLGANQRAAHGGQETDYGFRLPPDMAEADRIRATDDVDLIRRQQDAAETQRRAAEALVQSQELLRGTAQQLGRTGEAVRDNRDDLNELRQNSEEISEQLAQARDQVNRTRVPGAGPSSGSDDSGGANR
ncbi:MAG TPA: hypothetical protein VF665_06170 [Longimicrobium sp.]|jgi:chromosome segregation ATPase|uniref:hypothetical protein n=1 Tax=Longimicrobium sp. TaxID=2029185 RepID=UPI002ED7DAB1